MSFRRSLFTCSSANGEHSSVTTLSCKAIRGVVIDWSGDVQPFANARLVAKTKHGERVLAYFNEGDSIIEGINITCDGRCTIKVIWGGDERLTARGVLLLESETAWENHNRGRLPRVSSGECAAAR